MATFAPDGNAVPDPTAAEDEIRHLRRALTTRPVIDQAKGMIIAQHGCTPDEAFAMLAAASQRLNRKVIDIAAAMIAGAGEPGGSPWPAQVKRAEAADQRDRAADARDDAADDRDFAADDRDLMADRRDEQAQVRERVVAEQAIDVDAVIAGALVRDQLAEYRDRRAEARDRAAESRVAGTDDDTTGAASDRDQADADRFQSGEDRDHSAGDRADLRSAHKLADAGGAAALGVRQEAASDRAQSAVARLDADLDRGAAGHDRKKAAAVRRSAAGREEITTP